MDNYCEHHQHPLQKGYSKIRLPNTVAGGTSKTARHTFKRNSFSSIRFKFHGKNNKNMLSLSTSLVMALGARLLAQIFPGLPLTKKTWNKTKESVSISVNDPDIFNILHPTAGCPCCHRWPNGPPGPLARHSGMAPGQVREVHCAHLSLRKGLGIGVNSGHANLITYIDTYGIYAYVVQARNPPPRWGWFLGLGVLPPWNPTIMQGTSASPPPPVGWVGCSMYVPT